VIGSLYRRARPLQGFALCAVWALAAPQVRVCALMSAPMPCCPEQNSGSCSLGECAEQAREKADPASVVSRDVHQPLPPAAAFAASAQSGRHFARAPGLTPTYRPPVFRLKEDLRI
jgi:hypothetical protein